MKKMKVVIYLFFIVKRMFWRYIEIEWKTCVFFEIFILMVIIDGYNQARSFFGEKLDNSIIFVENNNNNNNNKN